METNIHAEHLRNLLLIFSAIYTAAVYTGKNISSGCWKQLFNISRFKIKRKYLNDKKMNI